MARITDKQIKYYLDILKRQTGLNLRHGQRYGYNCLDIEIPNGKDTIRCGFTKKEMYEVIYTASSILACMDEYSSTKKLVNVESKTSSINNPQL